MAESEGAQERPERGRGHDPVTEHGRAGAGAQQVRVVDVTRTSADRVHKGEDLATRQRASDAPAKAHHRVHELLDPEALREPGHEQQAGVGDEGRFVEGP